MHVSTAVFNITLHCGLSVKNNLLRLSVCVTGHFPLHDHTSKQGSKKEEKKCTQLCEIKVPLNPSLLICQAAIVESGTIYPEQSRRFEHSTTCCTNIQPYTKIILTVSDTGI